MLRYILRRMIQMIPTLIGISVVTFLLVHLAPGSPVTTGYGATVSGGNVEDEARLYAKRYFLHLPLFVNLEIEDVESHVDDLLTAADRAMYESKKQKKVRSGSPSDLDAGTSSE